jgi:hypothetical protein
MLRRKIPLRRLTRVPAYTGHAHFWERALSRRRFLATTAAGALGLVVGSDLRLPTPADAGGSRVLPKPIPGGLTGAQFAAFLGLTLTDTAKKELFHTFGPLAAPGNDPITITDFRGLIAAAEIQGTGKGTNAGGAPFTVYFDNDMRFMRGQYIGVDGERHHGTIGFF